mmetsp:Transcript_10611/g.26771  ORF Transcript_10611/g.26771 Transcript_10611/m.26771 type:complete len:248 (+) Transcript_10611:2131-2874(+)
MFDRTVISQGDLCLQSSQLQREAASTGPITVDDTLLRIQVVEMDHLVVDQLTRSFHPLHLQREDMASLLDALLSQGLFQVQPMIEALGSLCGQLDKLGLPEIQFFVTYKVLQFFHCPIAGTVHSHLLLSVGRTDSDGDLGLCRIQRPMLDVRTDRFGKFRLKIIFSSPCSSARCKRGGRSNRVDDLKSWQSTHRRRCSEIEVQCTDAHIKRGQASRCGETWESGKTNARNGCRHPQVRQTWQTTGRR